jgi:hypothetical protein
MSMAAEIRHELAANRALDLFAALDEVADFALLSLPSTPAFRKRWRLLVLDSRLTPPTPPR